jgi:type I site-specific restriction endonuclease
VRDFINQIKDNPDPLYCQRVTADDGKLGEKHLEDFQDNTKTLPTILTTSQKLSTGVDALNIRNIVLLRPVKSMIEFKQIIGRGTRTFDGKDFFTIYDFVKAYEHFNDERSGRLALSATQAHRGPSYRRAASSGEDRGQAVQRQRAQDPLYRRDHVLVAGADDHRAGVHAAVVRRPWRAGGIGRRTARGME